MHLKHTYKMGNIETVHTTLTMCVARFFFYFSCRLHDFAFILLSYFWSIQIKSRVQRRYFQWNHKKISWRLQVDLIFVWEKFKNNTSILWKPLVFLIFFRAQNSERNYFEHVKKTFHWRKILWWNIGSFK